MKTPSPATTATARVAGKSPSVAWQSDPWVLGGGGLTAAILLYLVGSRLFRKKPIQSARTPAPLPADYRLGDYVLKELIANGGTATIYRGEDLAATPVAVKIPHAEQLGSREFAATFLREAEIGLDLRHPSIVRVVHVGSYRSKGFPKIPYFVMEYLEGQELDHLIAGGALEPRFASMVARSVADALQWAHARGVVHRDISPANIFITSKRLVKVMDFGISFSSRARGRGKALSFGTPAYLAPERSVDSRSCDARSDLYSLGCVIYEMLTGRPPYVDEKPELVIQKHCKSPIPSLRENSPNVIPPELEKIVVRLLAKDPKQRYQSAGEVVSALAELIQDQ